MKRQFVTFSRATIAYIVALSAGALAFIPLLFVINGIASATSGIAGADYGSITHLISVWLRVELGALLATYVFLAIPLSPFFAVAMLFARHKNISHWIYYVVLGTTLATSLILLLSVAGKTTAPFRAEVIAHFIVLVAVPVGVLAGGACWLCLRITYSNK
ncbi:hypothetical protein ACW9YV_21930 (plasmid) [Paraburkholderia strydomiana]